MIHPATELRYINEYIGYGVFATEDIPLGTIVYVEDPLEVKISPSKYQKMKEPVRQVLDKYSYRNEKGVRILSWDNAKFINHSCDCNSMSTGWGFEIAIKNIKKGEEITDDYGLLNIEKDFFHKCDCFSCRGIVSTNDLSKYYFAWDEKVRKAVDRIPVVSQPIMNFMKKRVSKRLKAYLEGIDCYESVLNLRCLVHS